MSISSPSPCRRSSPVARRIRCAVLTSGCRPRSCVFQGVIVGLHNMLEKPMFEDPVIRQACADAGTQHGVHFSR